jgi:uncharacterized protein YecE (DUF72 family)
MRVFIGTSGFSYGPWRGTFYPEKLPAAKMLAYYAERLDTVEINNTFYRMPAPEMLAKWAAETPDGFRFALKSPRRITHEKKLADVADSLTRLREAAGALGERLGLRATVEFRHESWFTPDVYEALRARDVALCLAESEDLATPVEQTSSWGYLRLRRQDYDDAALAAWADRVRARAWDSAYVYFKHEDEGVGPKLAAKLRALLG